MTTKTPITINKEQTQKSRSAVAATIRDTAAQGTLWSRGHDRGACSLAMGLEKMFLTDHVSSCLCLRPEPWDLGFSDSVMTMSYSLASDNVVLTVQLPKQGTISV